MNPLILKLKDNQYVRYGAAFAGGILLAIVLYPSGTISTTEKTKIEEEVRTVYETKLKESEEILRQEKIRFEKDLLSVKQENSKRELELSTKLNSLISENSSLKKKTKMVTIEKIYPNGTIERKTISTSELEYETQRMAQIQQEAEQKLKDTVSKLNEQHSKEITEKTSSMQSSIDKLSIDLATSERLRKEEIEKSKTVVKTVRPLAVGLGVNTDRQYTVEAQYMFLGPLYVGASYDNGGISNNRAGISLGIRF